MRSGDQDFDLNQGLVGAYSKLKIFHHRDKMDALLEGRLTAPIAVRVKPTNKCNHGCFYCVYDASFSCIHQEKRRKDEIPLGKIEEILNNFSEMGVKAVIYSGGGEPLFHPNAEDFLEFTVKNKLDLAIISNGQCLNGKKAELLAEHAFWVRLSMDYCDLETFIKTRAGNEKMFKEIIDNIKRFVKMKNKDCEFELAYNVHEYNYHRIIDSAKFFKDLGFENVRFGPVWKPGFVEYHAAFRSTAEKLLEKAKKEVGDDHFKIGDTYTRDFEMSGVPDRKYTTCYWMQICPAIGADQVVYTCPNKAYDLTGAIGSLKERSFKDLWQSRKTLEIYKSFNPQESCRHQCTADEKNCIINEWRDSGNRKVVNFP